LKFLDKQVIYGLILCGIGYLYVGYTWRDLTSLVITSIQSLLFLFIAYYGIKKSMIVLAAGYFLHGIWDLVFDFFPYSSSIPPHYDVFCLSIDFTIGFYLLLLIYRKAKSVPL
jgi:flagellar biosynthesis protein FlhB